ncbi:MAG: hypothetical protein ACREBA_04315 [Nitrosotalea sp.]
MLGISRKSERELRKLLHGLSDNQIKKLVDGIDVSPFPVLLASEYERRFGYDKPTIKKILAKIRREIREEQNKQWIILNKFKKELDIVKNTRISDRGLDELSEKSIMQIQNKRISTLSNLQKHFDLLFKSLRKTAELEYRYTSFNSD